MHNRLSESENYDNAMVNTPCECQIIDLCEMALFEPKFFTLAQLCKLAYRQYPNDLSMIQKRGISLFRIAKGQQMDTRAVAIANYIDFIANATEIVIQLKSNDLSDDGDDSSDNDDDPPGDATPPDRIIH